MTVDRMAIGVVGAGTMGAGIAQVAATAGHPTFLFDAEPGRAAKGCEEASAALERIVKKGRVPAAEASAAASRLIPVDSLADLTPCGLVIEAVVESLDVKRTVFAQLAGMLPDSVLASNTSSISIDAIAARLPSPGRVVGMHFFNPAVVMRLVEVVSGAATDPAVVDRVCEIVATWRKVPVRVASTPGFVVNRVARPFYGEAQRLLEEGAADAATIDAVMREAGGFRMGPLELTDLIGQDVNLAVSRSVWEATGYDPRYAPSAYQRSLVEAGRLGRKTGQGVYPHPGCSRPPATEPSRPAPAYVQAGARTGPLVPLVERAAREGIRVEYAGPAVDALVQLDFPAATARLGLGTPATGKRADKPVVMLDLALDYRTTRRLAVAPSVGCPADALGEVVGFLQAAGLAVSVIDDAPGLIVTRTVARLVNEAVDLVGRGIVSAADADLAMRLGANYPVGPLEWGDRIGSGRVCSTLDNLENYYRDARYRPSPFLRRLAAAGIPLCQASDVTEREDATR